MAENKLRLETSLTISAGIGISIESFVCEPVTTEEEGLMRSGEIRELGPVNSAPKKV